MQEDFNIRTAVPADAELILSFIKKIAEYEHMSDQVTATAELLKKSIFEDRAAFVFIGEFRRAPVGFALCFENFSTFNGRAGIHLEDLFVDPAMRGKGFGKALFQAVAAEAERRGCERMEWACLNWNTPSIEFYRHMGATTLDEWTTYRLSGEAIHQAVMR